MLVENQIAPHMHTPERHGLRNGPLHRSTRRRDGESFSSPPECGGRIVVVMAGVRMNVAADVNRIRR